MNELKNLLEDYGFTYMSYKDEVLVYNISKTATITVRIVNGRAEVYIPVHKNVNDYVGDEYNTCLDVLDGINENFVHQFDLGKDLFYIDLDKNHAVYVWELYVIL